ncbi:MAG: hypothetical protein KAR14_11480, partial [Candidatus Aminicenantes bacterium]|nr:hypothetical protein [Candidatus Aminicenantes bacterium]
MIKKILIITLIFVYGCSSSINEEKIKSEIQKKKDNIVSLQSEIRGLEKQLTNNGMGDTENKIF